MVMKLLLTAKLSFDRITQAQDVAIMILMR